MLSFSLVCWFSCRCCCLSNSFNSAGVTGDFSLAGVCFGNGSLSAEASPLHEVGHLSDGHVPGQRLHPQVSVLRQQDHLPLQTSRLVLLCSGTKINDRPWISFYRFVARRIRVYCFRDKILESTSRRVIPIRKPRIEISWKLPILNLVPLLGS